MELTTAANLALLILRVVVGLTLAAHGWNKFTGGGKIPGTGRWFDSIGMRPGRLNAYLAASTEMGAGVSTSIIHWAAGRVPLLGVCLGHQAIGAAWGGSVVRAPEVMHGKTSLIQHRGDGVFAGLPNPLEATRYHSLIVERDSVPDELEITATSEEGLVMGLRHREFDVEGVQFHPESILTAGGHDLLANFLARVS